MTNLRVRPGPSTTARSPLLPPFAIDRATGVPFHRQIYDAFREAILGGLLRPGQRVPSTRGLAHELRVSRLPVLTAYDQLLHEGYLEGRVGSGTFVSAALPDDLLLAGSPSSTGSRAGARPGVSRPLPRPRDEGGLGPFRLSLPAL